MHIKTQGLIENVLNCRNTIQKQRKIQNRKLSLSTINPNNPVIPIWHNYDLHLTLPNSIVLSFEINLDLG